MTTFALLLALLTAAMIPSAFYLASLVLGLRIAPEASPSGAGCNRRSHPVLLQ